MKNILPILLLVLSALLFYFYIGPRYSKIQALSLERENYDDILSKSAELREIRRELQDKLNNLSPAVLERLEKTTPRGTDIPQLVLDLDSLALKHGIIMRQISTQETEGTGRGRQTESPKSYKMLAVTFHFEASYANLTSFLKDLETSARIIDVVSLKVNPNKEEPLIQSYDLTLHTYWLND
ncbi:MAG: Uncharacterized protein G01um1014107_341 [Parcubacteria group bacterium Gr01-1014_107]|nr:MAG: Uncharacterized protein G01um1014107_341 [Parcubacteria group bacterium Gr01-1014_107]